MPPPPHEERLGGAMKAGMKALGAWPATAAVSFVAAVLTWRWQAWKPVLAGLSSWQAGTTLAFLQHLQWGPQVVFTFGPYGFLEDALPFARSTAFLGVLYGFGLRWGLAGLVVAGLRRSWGIWVAGLAAWLSVGIAANLAEAPEVATAVSLGLFLAILRSAGGRRRLVLLSLLGGLAGVQMLVEVNTGLVCIGLAVLAVFVVASQGAVAAGPSAGGGADEGADGGRRWRAVGVAVAAAAGPFVVILLGMLATAGQSLTNLPSYLRGSLSVAVGYTQAMSLSSGRHAEDWLALVDVAILVAVFALVIRGRAWQEKLAISLGLAGWTWSLAKEGFVRHDLHDLTFFGLVVAAACLAQLPRRLVPLQATAVVVTAALALVANGGVPLSLRSPVESAGALAGEIGDLASTKSWAGVETVAMRQAQRTGAALPGSLVEAVAQHSFAVEPLEDSMSFAFPALKHWDPEPVLQAYSAYTPYLDHLDEAFLLSQRAPDLILYQPVSTSSQDPAWEPPATTEAMYCRYTEETTADYWVLLRRVTDRCGDPSLIGRAIAHYGQVIAVPSAPEPGEMVVARFSVNLPAFTGLTDALWKAPAVYATVWSGAGGAGAGGAGAGGAGAGGAGAGGAAAGRASGSAGRASGSAGRLVEHRWRFVTATAGEDHVMSAPALGWTAGYGPAPVRRIELSGGGWRAGQGTVRVSFYAVRLAAEPGA